MKKEQIQSPDGKEITVTEHEDGRKDVNIEVQMLDVKETDPATLKAKEHIEGKIMPHLQKAAQSMVLVVVAHKFPDPQTGKVLFTQKKLKAAYVKDFIDAALDSFQKMYPETTAQDFLVFQHYIDRKEVMVTTIQHEN